MARVKRLEWFANGDLGGARYGVFTPLGIYRVGFDTRAGGWFATIDDSDLDEDVLHATESEAMAACQDDFERRVMACLEVDDVQS